VDRAGADAEQGDAERRTQREVQRADDPERPDVDVLVDGDGHEARDESQRRQHRGREEHRDDALGALGRGLVDVLDAGLVRRQPGVGERIVRDGYRAVPVLLAGQLLV
jgi:hypothetical protein